MPPKHKKPKHPKGKKTNKMNILKGMGSYSKPRRVKGHGGYAEDLGGQIGGWLGKKAGGLFSSIFGLGEYKVNKNSLLKAQASDPPMVSNTSGGTRIQHREYIQDMKGSVDFQVQTFSVQPGLAETFPWLSSVAGSFEEYILHGILFEFKSTSADALNSTNTALGTVIMATEYNPLHGPFTAKRDMENYVYSTSAAPSISQIHPIECARDVTVLSELFVRNVPLTGADLRFSDLGLFQIATVGMQAAAVIGELWVTYDIELLKPKLPDAFSSIGPAHYRYSTSVPYGINGVPTSANIFGTPALPKFQILGTGATPVKLTTNTIQFTQIGRYLLIFEMSGDLTAITDWTASLGSDVTASGILCDSNSVQQHPSAVTSQAKQCCLMTLNVNSITYTGTTSNTTVTIGGLTVLTNLTGMAFWAIPLPTGFSTPKVTELQMLQLQVQQLMRAQHRIHTIVESDEEDMYNEALPSGPPVLQRESDQKSTLSSSTSDLVTLLRERLAK